MIVVVGAGISGVACARALVAAGHQVRVLDRGRRPGGRIGLRTVPATGLSPARPVDIGASYLTAEDPRFAAVVRSWVERGLARPWTDTFHVSTGSGLDRTKTGPMRYGAAAGLRGLVDDLAAGLDVTQQVQVTEVAADGAGLWRAVVADGAPLVAEAVVLATPDPQAARVLPAAVLETLRPDGAWPWDPVIAVSAAWPKRWWPDAVDGVFVNDDPTLSWIADDGRRRGDGAAVLVAHSTPDAAAQWLAEPDHALAPMLAAAGRAFATPPPEPSWTHVQRWGLAKPRRERPAPPFFLDPSGVGVCGDAWGQRSSVEGAWLSGTLLGEELAGNLG